MPGARASTTCSPRPAARTPSRPPGQLTTIVDGKREFIIDPPVVQRIELPGGPDAIRTVFEDYRATMAESRREFLERYRFADFALKVVGVGSVGTRCLMLVLEGRDHDDPLILQAKEATASVLEAFAGGSGHANHGERVVVGQRLMQATPDIFLGWTRGPGGRDFYLRQLWDMKGSVDTATLLPEGLGFYGGICAWALARAHARTGDSVAISAYLGTGDVFDGAIADFAEAYADQNAKDHAAYVAAIKAGRVSTTASVYTGRPTLLPKTVAHFAPAASAWLADALATSKPGTVGRADRRRRVADADGRPDSRLPAGIPVAGLAVMTALPRCDGHARLLDPAERG